jgi:hypothetical protein
LVDGLGWIACLSGIIRVVVHCFAGPLAAVMAHVEADDAPVDECLFF